MKTITVSASKTYSVVIGSGLIGQLGTYSLTAQKPCKAAIISDSNVWPLYGFIAENSLTESGFEVIHYTFPAGEESKSFDTYFSILNFLAENQMTRSDLIIALGGGVTGDMAGFAAATYLRGVRYIQVPTTLLAMVDSSVGGKTAIDLPAGKNLAGAFYQPSLVLCDINTLDTLPDSVFIDGCAEVIKYGALYDRTLFNHLGEKGLDFQREYVITRCVELKKNVVVDDEYDNGARQKLNLGHTIGHGIEKQSHFSVSHGQAVAIGMAIVSKAASNLGICKPQTVTEIVTLLQKFSLPTQTQYTSQQLYINALSDKKRNGSTVNLIVPEDIGCCSILPTPVSQLQSFIEAGLT